MKIETLSKFIAVAFVAWFLFDHPQWFSMVEQAYLSIKYGVL